MRQAIVVMVVYQLKSRVIVWRDARRLRPRDRLSSPPSVMLRHLTIIANKTSHIIVYQLKLRAMVWRAARCLRPCDRLSSPSSVMLSHLIIRVDETSHSLLVEVVTDGTESCKVSKTL